MSKLKIQFFILLLSLTFFVSAKDSLMVKTIEYWENGTIVRLEKHDTLKRIIAIYHFDFLQLGSDKKENNVTVINYFPNSKNIKSQAIYNFSTTPDSVRFVDNTIGLKVIYTHDSIKSATKIKYLIMKWDKKHFNKQVSLDSLLKLPIIYERDFNRYFGEYFYDNNGNLKIEKHGYRGITEFNASYTYDLLNRKTMSFVERKFEEKVKDPKYEILYTINQVFEKSIVKIRYDDQNRTSESVNETYRKKKLYSKKSLKNYFDENKNLIIQEEYEFNVEKSVQVGEPILVSRKSNLYENGLRKKEINEDFRINSKQIIELKYTFW